MIVFGLAMNVIEEIHRKLPNTHLVMHGSSSVPEELQEILNRYGGQMKPTWGVPVEEIQRGIKNGVRKINIDTDGRMAMTGRDLAACCKRIRPTQVYEARHGGVDEALAGSGLSSLERRAMLPVFGRSPSPRWPSATSPARSTRSSPKVVSGKPLSSFPSGIVQNKKMQRLGEPFERRAGPKDGTSAGSRACSRSGLRKQMRRGVIQPPAMKF